MNQAAQEQAEEIGRGGSTRLGRGTDAALAEKIERYGYQARIWTEGLIATTRGLHAVVSDFKQHDALAFQKLLEPACRDLGLGLASLNGMPLYILLFAVPEREAFAHDTAGLRDLRQVRAEVLGRVNAARKRAGLPPLTPDPRLDQAAERHAEDMLARSYFAHQAPDGTTVRERTRAAGYAWRAVGENIALGQMSVAEVMDSWLESREHRENILDRDFTQLGVGLTLGRDAKTGEYRTLWVQCFGRPQEASLEPRSGQIRPHPTLP